MGVFSYFSSMSELLQILVNLDHQIFHWINITLAFPFGDIFFPAITDLHKTWQFKFLFAPFLLFLFARSKAWDGVVIFFGLALTLGFADKMGSLVKHGFERQRPFEIIEALQRSPAGGFSFPSNHAINMFGMFFFMSYFFPKFRWLYICIAVLVAYSRVYNGVHFPSDVLAGAVIGSLFGMLGSSLVQKLLHKLEPRFKRGVRG